MLSAVMATNEYVLMNDIVNHTELTLVNIFLTNF